MLQVIIVGLIVVAALGYVLRNTIMPKKKSTVSGGCDGCDGCALKDAASSNSCQTPPNSSSNKTK